MYIQSVKIIDLNVDDCFDESHCVVIETTSESDNVGITTQKEGKKIEVIVDKKEFLRVCSYLLEEQQEGPSPFNPLVKDSDFTKY